MQNAVGKREKMVGGVGWGGVVFFVVVFCRGVGGGVL